MIVRFALSIQEKDETTVMEKVLELTRRIKRLGFKIDDLVVEGDITDLMDRYVKTLTLASSIVSKAEATAAAAYSKI